jgi:hypothetical protein
MRVPNPQLPEEPRLDNYARFLRLLTVIAAVPKNAIVNLNPEPETDAGGLIKAGDRPSSGRRDGPE